MNKFRNRRFNRLYEFMKEMDSSDDYLMIQVSSLDLGNNEVEMSLIATGMKEGDSSIHEDDFVELLTEVMKKSVAFKRLITKAVRKCAQLDNCPWMIKS